MPYMTTLYRDNNLVYPTEKPFHPSELYPELVGVFRDTYPKGFLNSVYRAVRETLHLTCLDDSRFGTSEWNPLGKFIKPGFKVVIKPNFVLHETGDLIGKDCLTTHGSVIRPLVDYAYLALQGRGEILIVDAPIQTANFVKIAESKGLYEIQSYYKNKLGFEIKIIDLRQVYTVWDEESGYLSERRLLAGDPKGYVTVDLQDESAFEGFGNDKLNPSRFAVTDYDLKSTRARHKAGHHEYVISRTVLEADTVILVPKLKVHEKVGLTVCLKGMVGIVGSKDCLPHFRVGPPCKGGDEFMDEGRLLSASWRSVRDLAQGRLPLWLWRILRRGGKGLAKLLLIGGGRFREQKDPMKLKPIICGGWYGNDTAWRMVADLNRIIRHLDTSGKLCNEVQRNFFALVDGIIAGEGCGPLVPSPRHLGLIIAGENPWTVDVVCAAAIGIDWRKLPMLRHSVWREDNSLEINPGIKLFSNSPEFACFDDLLKNAIPLTLPPGWFGKMSLENCCDRIA